MDARLQTQEKLSERNLRCNRPLSHQTPLYSSPAPTLPPPPPMTGEILVPPPTPTAPPAPVSERLRRLVQKFDPVERDNCDHALGKAGEALVGDVERRRLTEANRSDLAGTFDGPLPKMETARVTIAVLRPRRRRTINRGQNHERVCTRYSSSPAMNAACPSSSRGCIVSYAKQCYRSAE
jgi:hypothetical protein